VPQLADGAGFIVLDTKLDALRSIYLQSRGQYGAHANLLVLDKSGKLLFSARPAGEYFGGSLTGDEAAARILESPGPLLEAGGRGYYQVTHKSALGYTYCSVTEKSAVDKAVSWVALFVRFAVLLPLAIGLVLSGVCVFSLYRPVNTLLAFGGAVARRPPRGGGNEFAYFREIVCDLQQQSDSLREHIETMRPDLRARLLSGFLRGEWDNGDHGLAKKCAENGICVDGAYVVMLIDMGQRQKPETLRLAPTAVGRRFRRKTNIRSTRR
jgi:hypothetical protein